jgi:hypothetical protein
VEKEYTDLGEGFVRNVTIKSPEQVYGILSHRSSLGTKISLSLVLTSVEGDLTNSRFLIDLRDYQVRVLPSEGPQRATLSQTHVSLARNLCVDAT